MARRNKKRTNIGYTTNYADIRLDHRLKPIHMIAYAEIDNLDKKNGCTASNEWLAACCHVSVSSFKRALVYLMKLGYVTKEDGVKDGRILHTAGLNLQKITEEDIEGVKMTLDIPSEDRVNLTLDEVQNDPPSGSNRPSTNVNKKQREKTKGEFFENGPEKEGEKFRQITNEELRKKILAHWQDERAVAELTDFFLMNKANNDGSLQVVSVDKQIDVFVDAGVTDEEVVALARRATSAQWTTIIVPTGDARAELAKGVKVATHDFGDWYF